MNKWRLAVVAVLVMICVQVRGSAPEMFFSSGKNIGVKGGVFAAGVGSKAAYYMEPGVVIFASENSSFTAGKNGIVLSKGELYVENFSGQPAFPVKAGGIETISAGRAFFISAQNKSVEAVKGVTSFKSGGIETSIPEGKKFSAAGITDSDRVVPYEGSIIECIIEEGPMKGIIDVVSSLPKPMGIKELHAEQRSDAAEIRISIRIKKDSGVVRAEGRASQEGAGAPVVIFRELQGAEKSVFLAGHAVLREIASVAGEFEKQGFVSGREVALIFDTTGSGVISEAEEVIKSLPGIKKSGKEELYGRKTIIKILTRADGHMIGRMFAERSKSLKPVITHKSRVVF